MYKLYKLLIGVVSGLYLLHTSYAQTPESQNISQNKNIKNLLILPSLTNSQISNANAPHLVMYDSRVVGKPSTKLLVFMPGTGGMPRNGPKSFYQTVVGMGYQLISLSYPNAKAVTQICSLRRLKTDSNCAIKVRMKRVFGENTTALIDDEPQDAIVSRLAALLQYLKTQDKMGGWGNYLDTNGQPLWDNIVLSGQSQGGGMALFISKYHQVARVISFSGGWDMQAPGKIASWYSLPSATPEQRLFGVYNVTEPMASVIAQTYDAINIPASQQFALNQPVPPGKQAHLQGVNNPVYKPVWVKILNP